VSPRPVASMLSIEGMLKIGAYAGSIPMCFPSHHGAPERLVYIVAHPQEVRVQLIYSRTISTSL
jgi:hypothetical protein